MFEPDTLYKKSVLIRLGLTSSGSAQPWSPLSHLRVSASSGLPGRAVSEPRTDPAALTTAPWATQYFPTHPHCGIATEQAGPVELSLPTAGVSLPTQTTLEPWMDSVKATFLAVRSLLSRVCMSCSPWVM